MDKDKCKKYGTHPAGGPQAAIIVIVPSFYIRWNIGHHDSADIQYGVPIALESQVSCEINFQGPSKEKQRDHIEQQVKEVSMDKSAGDEAIVLMPYIDRGRPEYKVIHDALVAECGDGYQTGKD
jgi:hypothetical protein